MAPVAPPVVPPPLPPEWSEALEQVRAPVADAPAERRPGPGYGAGPMGGFASDPADAPALDRRSSAALEPPPVERDRRNTVALSLAGLFDDLGAPEITTAPPPPKRTTPSFFEMQDEEEEAAAAAAAAQRRGPMRSLLSPGGIIAAIAVVAALYIVGYVVSRETPPKPPTDQVTTVSHTR